MQIGLEINEYKNFITGAPGYTPGILVVEEVLIWEYRSDRGDLDMKLYPLMEVVHLLLNGVAE